MIRQILILSTSFLLFGCAAKVIGSNERSVIVSASHSDAAGAMGMAQQECAKYGRHARLIIKPHEDRKWVFDCTN